MLKKLYIKNYALISQLEIDFQQGFSVITGETGAGKSIILGALGLLMGDRADSQSIAEGEQKSIVEALFQINTENQQISDIFRNNDLDLLSETTIRREVSQNGKSRAFVNDTPVPLSVLKQIREQLIDIHSQHANLLLADNSFQLEVVDTIAQTADELAAYKQLYKQYTQTKAQLSKLKEQANKEKEELEFIQFQFSQLSDAKLVANEEIQLEEEHRLLSHTEEIAQNLSEASAFLSQEQGGVLDSLKQAVNRINHISQFISDDNNLLERTQSALIELKDIAYSIRQLQESTEPDPQRLAIVEQRLDTLNTLMQKHRVRSTQELIAIRDNLQSKLDDICSYDDQINNLQLQLTTLESSLNKTATDLSEKRSQSTTYIQTQINNMLVQLAMPNAKTEIKITPFADYTPNGIDNIQILFAANKNQTLRPVADIASGGEMSRLMLCIKSLMVTKQDMPTIIFDEIDTGVSGEVADKMASIMQTMSNNGRQIIAITHLPQIAARGNQQYKVFKTDTETKTITNIQLLSNQQRITEIAALLSAGKPSQAALNNAKELLKNK